MSEVYSYDYRTAEAPANVLTNAGRACHQIERDLGRQVASVKGLWSQLSMMARSTHDKHVQDNFRRVTDLKTRLEEMYKEAKALAHDFDDGAKAYR